MTKQSFMGDIAAVAGGDVYQVNVHKVIDTKKPALTLVPAQIQHIEQLLQSALTLAKEEDINFQSKLYAKMGVECIDNIERQHYETAVSFLEAQIDEQRERNRCKSLIGRILKSAGSDNKKAVENYANTQFKSALLKNLTRSELEQVLHFSEQLRQPAIHPSAASTAQAKADATALSAIETPLSALHEEVLKEIQRGEEFKAKMGFEANRFQREALYPLILCGECTPKTIRDAWREFVLGHRNKRLTTSLNWFQIIPSVLASLMAVALLFLGVVALIQGGKNIQAGVIAIVASALVLFWGLMLSKPIMLYVKMKPIVQRLNSRLDEKI